MTRLERNRAAVATLHSEFAPLADEWLLEMERAGRRPLIVQARRTFEQQADIYAQGRSKPGRRVTNAAPGRTYHNYGLAFDFLDVKGGRIADEFDEDDWDKTLYQPMAAAGIALGMEWGGLWRSIVDKPHLEWHPGMGAGDAHTLAAHCLTPGYLPSDFFLMRSRK